MYLETMDTVVVSDLHGHDELLAKVIERYPGVRIISNADEIDGKDSRALFDLAGEHDILRTTGNHELVTRGSLQAIDPEVRAVWQDMWRHDDPRYRQYEHGTLRSYGISNELGNAAAAEKLFDKMDRLGHIALLNEARMYYETDDFIVVHAGLTELPWLEQRKQLDGAGVRIQMRDFTVEPEQIMDRDFSLSNGTASKATDKIVISGHAHRLSNPERVIDNGRRIRLASRLAIGESLYAWQSWDNEVVTIE